MRFRWTATIQRLFSCIFAFFTRLNLTSGSSANTSSGYFGLRTPTGQVVAEQRFGRFDAYTQLTVTAPAGSSTSLVAFAGVWANGDTWLQLDDVAVVAL